MRALPDGTYTLFRRLRRLPDIGTFLLVGGTALALRARHRQSEDLDFIAPASLDRGAIDRILEALYRQGCSITKVADLGGMLEFDARGADIADYAQRWKIDGVKLDFFTKTVRVDGAPLDVVLRVKSAAVRGIDSGHIRVADESSVFLLKAQLLEERLTLRDLFDLYVLLGRGRTIGDLLNAAASLGASPDAVKLRLLRGNRKLQDPPVNPLIDAPTDFAALQAWFTERINQHEQAAAAAAGKVR